MKKHSLPLTRIPLSDAKELNRKAQDIVSLYEAFISENPDDTNALILYGKFLNKVGQENHAIGIFLKADEINPKIAVVKQQIANFLVENNKPIDALPFFTATVEINPSIPEYHFHLGNFSSIYSKKRFLYQEFWKEKLLNHLHMNVLLMQLRKSLTLLNTD